MEGLVRMAPPILIGYKHDGVPATEAFPEFSFDDHILTRWERLLHTCDIPTNRNDLFLRSTSRGSERLSGCTVIHVGAASLSRRWPIVRWADVAKALAERGHDVVLTGSSSERSLADIVVQTAGLPPSRNLCGKTDISELADIVRRAYLVLSSDTGTAHLGTAFRRRTVTLYGPVSPAQWGPPPGCQRNITLWHGSYGDPYAEVVDPGLQKITVDEVLAATMQLDLVDQLDSVPAVENANMEWSSR
jgi:hypothetical protein